MDNLYRIHFGYSKSKKYKQAIEIADLGHLHETPLEGEGKWHIVSFTEDQSDLMWSLYLMTRNLNPKVYGADILSIYCSLPTGNYGYFYASEKKKERVAFAVERLKEQYGYENFVDHFKENIYKYWMNDVQKVNKFFEQKGYFGEREESEYSPILSGNFKKPEEFIPEYKKIRDYISNDEYLKAVEVYYAKLGDNLYGELRNELIYLKRLSKIPLIGRDLLYFSSESTRNSLLNENIIEYCSCIDQVLVSHSNSDIKSPLDILIENAPTMDDLMAERDRMLFLTEYLPDLDNLPSISIDHFTSKYDHCPTGRIFDRYPDQIYCCRVKPTPIIYKAFKGWIKHSRKFYELEFIGRGLNLIGAEIYYPKGSNVEKGGFDFLKISKLTDIQKSIYHAVDIYYTGFKHIIEGHIFYEIELIRNKINKSEQLGNAFLESVDDILREAENHLRVKHDLPRIGEGWLSEMRLFNLVKKFYPDAKHHYSPAWLKPMHLDIYVPSKRFALEYQGQQHYFPVDFFGGEDSFNSTVKRDLLKTKKCKLNDVFLIHWKYDEPIEEELFHKKTKSVKIDSLNLASS